MKMRETAKRFELRRVDDIYDLLEERADALCEFGCTYKESFLHVDEKMAVVEVKFGRIKNAEFQKVYFGSDVKHTDREYDKNVKHDSICMIY
jgi:hypothetical protein